MKILDTQGVWSDGGYKIHCQRKYSWIEYKKNLK